MPGPIVWSGLVCVIPRAGAYAGLCSARQQLTVARFLLPKRAIPYTGATVRMRPDRIWPLFYLAVRDPSAVAVVRSRRTQPSAPRRVTLRFGCDHAAARDLLRRPEHPVTEQLRRLAEQHRAGVFVVTIGLPVAREARFFQAVALDRPEQPWEEVCRSIEDSVRRVCTT